MAIEVTDEVGFSKTAIIVWGVLAIVVGFFLISNPKQNAMVFVQVMAIFWVVGGIIDVIRSIASRGDLWGLRLTLAIISIIAGAYILGNPILGTMFVVQISFIFLAISAIMYGIFNIIAGFKNEDGTSWAAIILGIIQIFIGIWLFGFKADSMSVVAPVYGTISLVPVLGAFTIGFGIMAIIASFWVNSPSDGSGIAPAAAAPEPAPAAEPAPETPSEPAA